MNGLRNAILATTVAAISLAGCHRQFYRQQADAEANCLMDEKSRHVARPPNQVLRIDIDRRSRMFNPFDLDFQPMPLDDPASYQYMQCVDGRRGYPAWEAAGWTNLTESPDWYEFLPLNEDGVLVLSSEEAVRVALMHSPEYQEQLETLYLSALAVSAERFVFDTQFFGGLSSFFDFEGSDRNFLGERGSFFSIGPDSLGARDLALQRSFATGGELIVGLANNIVWQLNGDGGQTSATLLDFAFVQPLLRGGGREIVLENLTQSERTLLANVRSFERFRRNFFLSITTGRGIEAGVTLGNPGVANVSGFGFGGGGGYLGLLQTQLEIRNQEENIARFQEGLLILEDTLIELLVKIPEPGEEGEILRQRLNVAQQRSALLNQQSSLVNLQAGFQAQVDAFLRDLGLPPYLCAEIKDPILDRFNLVDRELLRRREELSELRGEVGVLNIALLETNQFVNDPAEDLPVAEIQWNETIAETLRVLQSEVRPLTEFNRTLIEEDLLRVADDIVVFQEALPERRRLNEALYEVYQTEKTSICGLLNISDIDETIFDMTELAVLGKTLEDNYQSLGERFATYQEVIEQLDRAIAELIEAGPGLSERELAVRLTDDVIIASQDLLAALGDDVLALQLLQARARTESLILPPIDLDPDVAFEIAYRNRRDVANARAAVVDSWRQIEVAANDLQSSLDITVAGDIGNNGVSPFRFRTQNSSLRFGLQWDAPITRLLERNQYRATLIDFEQTRRDFYQLEDGIWQLLRGEIRELQANRLNFELGRQLIRNAAAQIELNNDILRNNEQRNRSAGVTAARDSIDALNSLLNAQNNLLGIFVGYEVVRRSLDFDLGTMELTPEGLWIDPGEVSADTLLGLAGVTDGGLFPCGLSECNCSDVRVLGGHDCCLPRRRPPVPPTFGPPIPEDAGVEMAPPNFDSVRPDRSRESLPDEQINAPNNGEVEALENFEGNPPNPYTADG